jgi:hypothetical protein
MLSKPKGYQNGNFEIYRKELGMENAVTSNCEALCRYGGCLTKLFSISQKENIKVEIFYQFFKSRFGGLFVLRRISQI